MFKRNLAVLLLAGVSCPAPAVVAQSNAPDSQAAAVGTRADRGPGHRHMDPQRRSQMLGKKLSLSSDQQAKVQDILQSAHSDMQKVRGDSSLAAADRRAKMMDIHKSASDQIRALLNPDQQKQWDAMQARQQQRMERRHQHAHPPAGAPAAPEQK